MSEDEIKHMCCEIYQGGEWQPMINYILNLQKELEQEKESNKWLVKALDETRQLNIELSKDVTTNYVKKDKIRNFIKEETKEGTYDFVTISAERLKELLKEE